MRFILAALFPVVTLIVLVPPVAAMEQVVVRRDGQTLHVSGRLITDAQDGGLLILGCDGTLWAIQPDEIVEHESDDQPFQPLSREELTKKVLGELPDGFEAYTTANYIIVHNTSKVYAQWCGALFERLHRGFTNFWEQRRMPIHEPEVPLVALVFKDKPSFVQYAQRELGEAASSIVGYYSLATNRVTMYNLTGIDARRPSRRLNSAEQISRVLSSPEAARTVATVVHEATHQLAFNCGLHERWGDVPMWVSEGIAVYFETPHVGSSKGWRAIGAVNRSRLLQFRQYLQTRPPDSLKTLLADDERFRTTETAIHAYAETWALTYYLLKTHSADYVKYLRKIADKPPLAKNTSEERLLDFRDAFGSDLQGLDESFVRQIMRLR
jgi:hypothetical protein